MSMYDNSQPEEVPSAIMGVPGVIWSTLAEFCRKTTIGGLCNAGLAPSKPRQAIWLIIFVVLVSLLSTLMTDVLARESPYIQMT